LIILAEDEDDTILYVDIGTGIDKILVIFSLLDILEKMKS
jgi:hypothetical protein